MLKFISRLLSFSGEDAWKLKASAAISFVEGMRQTSLFTPLFWSL
jgi:hypothetical protein